MKRSLWLQDGEGTGGWYSVHSFIPSFLHDLYLIPTLCGALCWALGMNGDEPNRVSDSSVIWSSGKEESSSRSKQKSTSCGDGHEGEEGGAVGAFDGAPEAVRRKQCLLTDDEVFTGPAHCPSVNCSGFEPRWWQWTCGKEASQTDLREIEPVGLEGIWSRGQGRWRPGGEKQVRNGSGDWLRHSVKVMTSRGLQHSKTQ